MGIFEKHKGSNVWWARFFDAGGKERRERGGTKREAHEKLAKRRAEIAAGTYVPPRSGRKVRFKALAADALNRKKLRLAEQTCKTDEIRLKSLLPLLGHVPIDQCTPERIEDVLAELRKTVSASTTNRFHSLLSSIFAFAVKHGKLPANPCSKVKRFKENASRIRWLRKDEEKRLRNALYLDSHEYEFDLALHTGMRKGEQFTLAWKDVDFTSRRLTVRGKTGQRQIWLNKRAIAALRRLEELTCKTPYVCPDMRDGLKIDGRRWFQNACQKARVFDFHWHDIRHTFASRRLRAGANIVEVQKLLGHATVKQTEKYAHLAPSHLDEAVEREDVEE
jgi:integrase